MTTYYYELWDKETRNLVYDFDDENEVREALQTMPNVAGLAIARRDERGRTQWLPVDEFAPAGTLA
jgi:hypothetical protein